MYTKVKAEKTSLNVNQSKEGETIEQKIERIVHNGEPITDGAPIVFTERKDGVRPEYDVRTDRFDLAVEAMDAVSRSNTAKREAKIIEMNEKKEKKDGGAESTQGTPKAD